jgi:hypothetical protein
MTTQPAAGSITKYNSKRQGWFWQIRWRANDSNGKRTQKARLDCPCEEMTDDQANEFLRRFLRQCDTATAQVKELSGVEVLRHSVRVQEDKRPTRGWGGKIAEHLVCADLLSRGIEVFIAAHPSSSCDMVAFINNEPVKIEVKYSRLDEFGRAVGVDIAHQMGKFDILAVVDHDGNIYYQPASQITDWKSPMVRFHDADTATGSATNATTQ